MPEVHRRRVVDEEEEEERPVRRRRDVVSEVDEDEEEDVDATERPVRARKTSKRTTKKRASTRRRPPDEYDYADEDEVDDDEEEEEPLPRKKAAATKKAAPRRRREPEPEEDEEEEEAPRRSRPRKAAAKKVAARSVIHRGLKGADEVARASGGGGGAARLTLTPNQTELIKVLEPEPLCSFFQHWISTGPGQANLPHVCLEVDCPLCEYGIQTNKVVVFNVLHFPEDAPPINKTLPLGIRAYKAFVASATPRGKSTPVFDRDFWAVSRSGKNQQSQTNFSPLKLRDVEEDWDEIFANFDDDIEDEIETAQENLFDVDDVAKVETRKQLRELGRIAVEDDDEE